MAAILRSGKFLRLFSGVARNLAAGSGKNDDTGLVPQHGLSFDRNFSQANFSIQNVLPYLGVSDSGHAEDRFPTRLLSTPNRYLGRVSREEIELMIAEIEITEPDVKTGTQNLLSSQALLAIRLCGSTLDQEIPSVRVSMVGRIWDLLKKKKIPLTTVHYNALLRVHLENGHKFTPEQVIEEMKTNGASPDKETFQCLISRYCQDGNIDGASRVLQMMKSQGIKVNENIFNSLILGHGEAGDMARSHGMLKVMKQWGLPPSQETYLTLACGYAKQGDWPGVERVMSECQAQGVGFDDGDYLELVFVMSEAGHKEHIAKLLANTHPETEAFSSMASHLVVRLVNSGHDDVAYNLVQYTVDQSCEEGGRMVSEEFLQQIVRVERPVTKLLWLVHDMAEKKLMLGGLDKMVDIAIRHKNFSLSYKLADILLTEGGSLDERHFCDLLKLAVKTNSDEDIISCAKLGKKLGYLTNDVLKKQIFPNIHNWPELVITSLEEAGVERTETVTPLVEWLIGQGKTEAASTLAGIFSEHVDKKLKFLTATSKNVNNVCNHFHENHTSSSHQEPVKHNDIKKLSEKPIKTETQVTTEPVNIISLSQAELEDILNSNKSSPATRGQAYLRLLETYHATGAVDQAIQLAERLKADDLHLPQFHDMFGVLIEPLLGQVPYPNYPYGMQPYAFAPHLNQFIPVPVPMNQGYNVSGYQNIMYPHHFYITSNTAETQSIHESPESDSGVSTPSPSQQMSSPGSIVDTHASAPMTPRTSISLSGTATPSMYNESSDYNFEANLLHRQLKRAIAAEKAEEGLAAYMAMETLGRTSNVTETSALIEQLIRADLMREASEVTQGMLFRNTHPLPKIFRFLLNKLAINGSVEDILQLGQYLPTKIKKDVSFDNRLCNAYLSAGRGKEFLEVLIADLDQAIITNNPEQMNLIKDQFPRGGAMGLLDTYPDLLDRYTTLAVKFATIDYVAPMNVLWTYHFINGNSEIAESIWQNYVKNSNQIMFQKVCQVARSTGNINLAFGLVRHLADAQQVTSGARGIAYSCLLDCLCAGKRYKEAYTALKEALTMNVTIEDINRTALVRLKTGIEEEGELFPINIPPKNQKRESEVSQSLDWSEMC